MKAVEFVNKRVRKSSVESQLLCVCPPQLGAGGARGLDTKIHMLYK